MHYLKFDIKSSRGGAEVDITLEVVGTNPASTSAYTGHVQYSNSHIKTGHKVQTNKVTFFCSHFKRIILDY